MEAELLKIFDDDRKPLGIAKREEVHRLGHWHETFHCWIISSKDERPSIYLQIRSEQKKDHPNLLDVTAVGHILANEVIDDGIRELREEIGIQVKMDALIALGEIDYCFSRDDFNDKEIAHVYLYDDPLSREEFTLQPEEVSGIVKAEINSFQDFCKGHIHHLEVEGFRLDPSGKNKPFRMEVDRSHFVPHFDYFKQIAEMIRKYIYE